MKVKDQSEKVGLKLDIQKTKIMASGPITSWQIDGETAETVSDFIFLGSKITADGDWSHEIKRCLLLGRKVMTNLDSILKSKDILCQQRSIGQSYGFSSGLVWIWELDYKESWVLKNWCFWTVVLAKTLESPLDCKEIQPVHPKGEQFWVFIGRTDAEAETQILCPPDAKSWLIWKDPDAGKDWGQEEKQTTEGEMVGWHHWVNGHGFGWTLRVDNGKGGLACCGSWGHRELDTTERLNWTELNMPQVTTPCWERGITLLLLPSYPPLTQWRAYRIVVKAPYFLTVSSDTIPGQVGVKVQDTHMISTNIMWGRVSFFFFF